MGNASSYLSSSLFGSQKEHRVFFHGLDGAGKTTILYQLKLGEVLTTIPTISYNVESVTYRNRGFVFWDVADNIKGKPRRRDYYLGTAAIIFVVDSSDKQRIPDAKYELGLVLEEFKRTEGCNENIPLLVFANKQDVGNPMSVSEISSKLELSSLGGRKWQIVGTVASKKEGLYEGLDWLVQNINP